jgi:Malectin domain
MATSLASGRDNGAPPNDRNRAELAAVLASDTFKRSPKLSRLLIYLCEKCFQGLEGDITEYAIGLDVLGRDPGFDPQQDALVRVDTHHLRKRLKEYYSTAGREHDVQIILPAGQYAPQFAVVGQASRPVSPTPPENQHPNPPKATQPEPSGSKLKPLWIAAIAALLLTTWWLLAAAREHAETPTKPPHSAPLATAPIRIAAGDRPADYTDHIGRIWMSDRFFQGGAAFRRGPLQIQRTLDGELFRSGREGQFVYQIPLSPGTYELHLYFAETGVASESLRSVSMAINSVPLSTVDIASDAGGVDTATVKIFKNISPAPDGILHLTFLGTGPSFLNALEIVPGIPGKMQPIRLTTRDSIYRDHLGQVWMPDASSAGGRRSTTTAQIEATADPGLYQADRIGHFSYSIPVVEGGRYTLRLHFAEPWFTQSDRAIGSRVFDVYCNGTTLLKDFDILQAAGGGKRAIVRVFHNIPASPQGKIDLTFVPVVNYALVNAIEIIEE